MAPPRITAKRLHILYTTPLVLGLASFFLIWVPLFSLVPWRKNAGTVLRVEHVNLNDNDTINNDLSRSAPTLYFGLLGSCYQPSPTSELECTHVTFPADYETTITRAGSAVNVEHLQITMPDLPPVFAVWALVSLLALILHLFACLPLYIPKKFYRFRFNAKPIFSASLWILGIGWAFGFSAVLSLACFVQGFGDEYNRFSSSSSPTNNNNNINYNNNSSNFLLNQARSGPIFYFFTPVMLIQILIGLSLLVAIENSPTKLKEAFSESWSTTTPTTIIPVR